MSVRPLAPGTLLACLVVFASACFRSETPTGPSTPAAGSVHVIGRNASAGSLGLTRYATGEPLSPVEVAPGDSVEMMRWSSLVQGTLFIVFVPIAEQPHFKAVAQVEYSVLALPASSDVLAPSIQISRDASGAVTATSERPDVVQILRVDPM